ncbi:MAG: hypothetical protein EXS39_01790 [Opitutaceae bacterium]|nr:hypothetical protein [Opitutaceae bacterium]
MRRLLAIAAALLLIVGAWLWRPRPDHREPDAARPVAGAVIPAASSAPTPAPQASIRESSSEGKEARITLADPLNAPDGDIHRDLRVLQDIFIAWRTNFQHVGHPVGENAEITAALTGENSLQLALIPKDHSALNSRGELCDRWGTPFRFHQLSGTQMEIRSAGPDRKFGTPDDAIFAP